ncbi:pyridine nucleotide-disulfide oxidoreductase family protein [Klebsiella pneumoniae]|uniref:Pyridine nucleotide-disulfide oxidoreductase family protein n=1 Tax=Klebsiella pneumoniae TaxID=573 RepID=A0A377WR96_KLEPN|nr:pyridine nucleotide-disulfide oxidoreductase family protein [Klebsiella pneumoniae]
MPGSKKEVKNAREEGALFEFNVQPVTLELDENGRVNGVRFLRTELGAPDAGGKTPSDADPRQRVCYAGRCGDHGLWLPPAPHALAGSGGGGAGQPGRIKAGVESRYRYQTSQEKILPAAMPCAAQTL